VDRHEVFGTILRQVQPSIKPKSPIVVALLAIGVATLIRLLLDPWLKSNGAYLFFAIAVVVAALYGGVWAGIGAIFLSIPICDYLFIEPRFTWFIHDTRADSIMLISFALLGALTTFIIRRFQEYRSRLHESMIELRRSNEDLTQFSYIASHDIQAPLRMIRCFTELLARKDEHLDEQSKEYLSMIVCGVRNMQQIIQALLHYAQAGQGTIAKERVSMEAVLASARLDLHSLISESFAQITNSALPTVDGDPTLLLQLLQNLLGNALKYARKGVTPVIDVSCSRLSREQYQFAVQDNGEGISSKDCDLIFAPFKRLHGHEIGGDGIGLSVCKKIVERHGGRIWVVSQPGAGSTFFFTLPVSR